MLQKGNPFKIAYLHNISTFLLPGVFLLGFVTGFTLACNDSTSYYSLIQRAATEPATLTALMGHVLVPFLLTSLICRSGRTELLQVLCFLLAFIHGTTSFLISCAFGSASWLVQPLLLFTATTTLASLFYFWFRCLSARTQKMQQELLFSIGFAVLSSAVDYFVISPFLTRLFI